MNQIILNSHGNKESTWNLADKVQHSRIPPDLLPWLLDTASLTLRLKGTCSGKFQVEVISQSWSRPMRNESRALDMRFWQYGFIREVRLLCDGQPWVFARTVIPRNTARGRERRLVRLGTKPLGEVLFADSSMRRGEVELACIQPGQKLFDLATDCIKPRPAYIWGRRSVFYLSQKPLLVSEIFLPALGSFNGV